MRSLVKKDTRTQWFNLGTQPPVHAGTYELKSDFVLTDDPVIIKARIDVLRDRLGRFVSAVVVTEEHTQGYKPGDRLPGPESQPSGYQWRGLARKPTGMALKRPGRDALDWDAIRKEWDAAQPRDVPALCAKYGITLQQMARRAVQEGWIR